MKQKIASLSCSPWHGKRKRPISVGVGGSNEGEVWLCVKILEVLTDLLSAFHLLKTLILRTCKLERNLRDHLRVVFCDESKETDLIHAPNSGGSRDEVWLRWYCLRVLIGSLSPSPSPEAPKNTKARVKLLRISFSRMMWRGKRKIPILAYSGGSNQGEVWRWWRY